MKHKLNTVEREQRKQAKLEIRKPVGQMNSVASLRERVLLLEQALGLKGDN